MTRNRAVASGPLGRNRFGPKPQAQPETSLGIYTPSFPTFPHFIHNTQTHFYYFSLN
ncbi:hypothetical protein HanPSC8_Chr03g0103251 [Helianthus annuus]|nr:hypothetical protein HanPSC8_Chr03g0103251 [Helianthus annuus]